MAGVTEHDGFPTTGCHHLDPTGFVSAFVLVEVFESTYMMNFNLVRHTCGPAVFTNFGQKPFF
jgi:hypothetical protein